MESEVTNYGELVEEFEIECPVCGGKMLIREVEYELPLIGRALIVSKKCTHCGYRRNDVVPLTLRKHRRLYIRVEKSQDLYVKVLRSPTARIYIPELGLELKPGVDAEMFITNIEGILQLFNDALIRLKVLTGSDVTQVSQKILEALKAQYPFTVVVDDPLGLSTATEYADISTQMIIECVE
jgi:zinc finger protein